MNFDTAIPVGRGASGEVLRAFDPARGEDVAIKVLSSDDPALVARMQREARAQGRLHHPHICPVYAIDELDGRACIVMRFIDGQPLHLSIQNLSRRQRVAMLRTVTDAVAWAHAEGVIHRDLKPANVLIEKRGDLAHPWLVDFGLARGVEDDTLTLHGQALGTPGYMAPEQARGEQDLDPRCDVYALGVILFEMIAGQMPHRAETVAEQLIKTVSEDAPSLAQLCPDCDPALVRIVDQCLERDPGLRYANAAELRDDLDAWLAGQQVAARSRGVMYPLRRWVRNRPGVSVALGVLVLAALVSLAVAITGWGSRSQHAREQAGVAQRYAQLAADLENRLRLIYAKPAHDVSDELQRLESELLALDQRADSEAPDAEAAIRFTLGRAWFALGRFDQARASLDRAWQQGARDSAMSMFLGRTYIAQYGEALEQVRLEPDPQQRAQRERELRRGLLVPGLSFLEQAGEQPGTAGILARAEQRYYSGEVEQAMRLLAGQAEQADWPAPLWVSAGRLSQQHASALSIEDHAEQVEQRLLQSNQHLERALTLLRSDPQAHRYRCRNAALRIGLRLAGLPQTDSDQFGMRWCDLLVQLEADDARNWVSAAAAYERLAALQVVRNEPASGAWQAAISHAGRALELDANLAEAWFRRGMARLAKSRETMLAGEDGSADLQAAVSDLERAVSLQPTIPTWYVGLAGALTTSARNSYSRGESGDQGYQRAVLLLNQAASLPGVGAATQVRIPATLTWQGYYRYITGQPADVLLNEAVVEARRIVEIYPDVVRTHQVLAEAAWTFADYLIIKRQDPEPYASEAIDAFSLVLKMDSSRFSSLFNALSTYLVKAEGAHLRGESAAATLAQAQALLDQLNASHPDDPGLNMQRASLARHYAAEAVVLGADPRAQLAAAREALQAVAKSDIDALEGMGTFAHVAVLEHQWRHAQGSFDATQWSADLEYLGRGVSQLPDFNLLRGERARLYLLAAESAAFGPQQQAAYRRQAQQDLQQATADDSVMRARYKLVLDQLGSELQ